jgi:hypothetical protein
LTEQERRRFLTSLNSFTGNTYGVNESLELVLMEVGVDSSSAATALLDSAIASDNEYAVLRANSKKAVTLGKGDRRSGEIRIDFDDFLDIDYGDVPSEALGIGAVFLHELTHTHLKLQDPKGSAAFAETGPVVNFVNLMRRQRGMTAQRGPVYGGQIGLRGRVKFNFQGINSKRPDKRFWVRVKNHQ